LQNIRTSGGKMKMPISAKETASFQGGLFILFLLGKEEANWTKKRKKRWPLLDPSSKPECRPNSLPSIPFCSSLSHAPDAPLNIKKTHRQHSNNGRTVGVLILPKHGANSIYTRSRSQEDKDQISLELAQ
jgi:hypothetical protein